MAGHALTAGCAALYLATAFAVFLLITSGLLIAAEDQIATLIAHKMIGCP